MTYAVGSDPLPADEPVRDPLARSVTVIVLLALLLILSINDHTDPDLWGHVRTPRTCSRGTSCR